MSEEMREFLMVLRQALLMVVNWIEKKLELKPKRTAARTAERTKV